MSDQGTPGRGLSIDPPAPAPAPVSPPAPVSSGLSHEGNIAPPPDDTDSTGYSYSRGPALAVKPAPPRKGAATRKK